MIERASAKSPRLRLLHLVLDLDPGGTQRLVIEMCKSFQSQAEIQVCCLDQVGEWSSELIEIGIPVFSLTRQPGFRPSLARRIAQIMRQQHTQVLHCHQYTPFVYGALAARLAGRPRLIFTEHGRASDAPPSAKRKIANQLLARVDGKIFAVSEDLRAYMVAEGMPESRVSVIYNGIDPGPMPTAHDRSVARGILGAPADSLVIGTVARLDPVKDLGTLLEGFALLTKQYTAARLVLIGEGPERDQLEGRVLDLGLQQRVTFLGNRDDVRQVMPGFDIFVNTSTTEGISLTILEAMAALLPVVATDVGGTPEVVVDDETGLLIEPSSPTAVAAALHGLMQSGATRNRMGEASRERIEARFNLASMLEQYAHTYAAD